jgi:hypothetical protein
MAEILGLGVTHFPPLAGHDQDMARILYRALKDPLLPEPYREPAGWPEAMRAEWGSDAGLTSAARHRDFLVTHFRKARQTLDDFRPDFVLVWGDDQYENFTEDVVPPFCLLAYESFALQPWTVTPFITSNVWDEPKSTALRLRGHRQAGKALAEALLGEGFDVAYAYKPLHHELGHAFLNTVLYLDYDRRGFDHPLVPFQVNCYGRKVISQRAGIASLAGAPTGEQLDPPSPMPWRCFDLGAAVARVLARSPWRVALVASSSWSHAFLTAKNYFLYPDIAADRVLYEALAAADYRTWRGTALSAMEESGQQEMLNWMCLAGAMAELGRTPTETAWIETHIFNSNKCFAYFLP